ncbi:MAG: hypothetical protein Q8P07_04210, partial [bacterium]|nr:hypothetical protein [bacterium]
MINYKNPLFFAGVLTLTFSFGSFIAVTNITRAAPGDVIASYNFEDGRVPQVDTPNLIPATVLTEPNGNRFFRLTSSPSDTGVNGGSPFWTYEPTVRTQVKIGEIDWTVKNTVTYNFSVRFPSFNAPPANVIAEIFQYKVGSEWSGWTTGFWADSGKWGVAVKNGISGLPPNELNFGNFPVDRWVNVSTTIYFSATAGRVDVTIDGQYKGFVNGTTVVSSGKIQGFYVAVYGEPGTLDFDNITVIEGSASIQPSTCTNLLNSSLAVPANFGASFNWFSSAKELLLQASCGSGGSFVTVGSGSNTQYIYKTG